jgi:hypothetical protein
MMYLSMNKFTFNKVKIVVTILEYHIFRILHKFKLFLFFEQKYRKNKVVQLNKNQNNSEIIIDNIHFNKKVLCWEPAPFPVHIDFISSIGTALSLRGAKVEQIICDGISVACIGRDIRDRVPLEDWNNRCLKCFIKCKNTALSYGIKTIPLSELLNLNDVRKLRILSEEINLEKINSYKYKDIKVGYYAVSSLIRYNRGSDPQNQDDLLREYLFNALITAEAGIKKIEAFKPDVVYMSHALYTSWGPMFEASVKRKIPVIRIGGGHRLGHTYFRKIRSHGSVHVGILSEEGWKERIRKSLTLDENKKLDLFFRNRYCPTSDDANDVSTINEILSKKEILNKLKLNNDKPIWCIFSHLLWDDAVRMSTKSSFRTFHKWMEETLKIISEIEEINWLIKIHPTEFRGDSAYTTIDIIEKLFPILPNHIKIIQPNSDINTQSVFNLITGGITCRGSIGLELSAMGKPVIIAADAYYSQLGFTYDGFSFSVYKELLFRAKNIPKLSVDKIEIARKLAYSYFIQRQIPLNMFKTKNGSFHSFDWKKVESLLPGVDPVVDMICDRFFEGEDFILNDEIIFKRAIS